jgi:hypothetical protein
MTKYIGNASYADLAVYVQYGLDVTNNYTVRTTRKLYQNNSFVLGSYSVIMRLNYGLVQNLTWDEGCLECSGNQCVDNMCGIAQDQCIAQNICNIKVCLVASRILSLIV